MDFPMCTRAAGRAALLKERVKPGLTGFWRVGIRREITAGKLLAQDANYIRNWTLTQDAKIFLMSLGVLLAGRNREMTVVTDTQNRPGKGT